MSITAGADPPNAPGLREELATIEFARAVGFCFEECPRRSDISPQRLSSSRRAIRDGCAAESSRKIKRMNPHVAVSDFLADQSWSSVFGGLVGASISMNQNNSAKRSGAMCDIKSSWSDWHSFGHS